MLSARSNIAIDPTYGITSRRPRRTSSERQGHSLCLVNGAKKIARRHAISNQPDVDTGVLKLLCNGIVGDARRRPDDHANAVEVLGSAGEDVAPSEDAI